MTNSDFIIQNLLDMNILREPVLKKMVESLPLAIGSRGLDIGCGIGLQSILLAEAVGSGAVVTGLDQDQEILKYAEGLILKAGHVDRILLKSGDMNHLPFENDCFDWVWSVDCVGYPAGDIPKVLKEIVRVTKPGGQVFLAAWSSQLLLPGYSLLEANLNAYCSAYLPFLHGQPPESHFMSVPHWMLAMGMKEVQCRIYLENLQAPFTAKKRKAIVSLIDMLWDLSNPGLSDEDRKTFASIGNANSPTFLPDDPAYYGFFTYTLFSAIVIK